MLELELRLSLERPLESDRTVDRVSNVVVLSLASAVEPKDVGDHERVRLTDYGLLEQVHVSKLAEKRSERALGVTVRALDLDLVVVERKALLVNEVQPLSVQ